MGSADSHPSDKNKDVRWMGHSFIPLRVGDTGGGLERNKNASTTKHGMGSADSHPSDKNKDVRWMGHSFIPLRVGNAGK